MILVNVALQPSLPPRHTDTASLPSYPIRNSSRQIVIAESKTVGYTVWIFVEEVLEWKYE